MRRPAGLQSPKDPTICLSTLVSSTLKTLPRPYLTWPLPPQLLTNREAVIPDVACVSWCFIIDISAPCILLSEQLAYNGRERMQVEEGWKQLGRRRASLSIVGRWEHKIKEVLVGRLHRSSMNSQLVHSALA